VQNKQRNYATYNIINGAFNFCKEDEIQMLLDGDDEFIGKYAFQVINSAYQQDPDLWVVYSNLKTNFYKPGWATAVINQSLYLKGNRRISSSAIGPIRTWRTKLIQNIPLPYHKMKNGKWLDTVSDDALQHSIL
jgi:hypothetical protein